jgi:hypothetical protein
MGSIFDWTLGTIPCASNDKIEEKKKSFFFAIFLSDIKKWHRPIQMVGGLCSLFLKKLENC